MKTSLIRYLALWLLCAGTAWADTPPNPDTPLAPVTETVSVPTTLPSPVSQDRLGWDRVGSPLRDRALV